VTRESAPKGALTITAAKQDPLQNTRTLLLEVLPRLEVAEAFAAQALIGQLAPSVALEGIVELCRRARMYSIEAAA
jgi:hypothetical protein